jgi:hypothetical protein
VLDAVVGKRKMRPVVRGTARRATPTTLRAMARDRIAMVDMMDMVGEFRTNGAD